jgi:hypothetical protein
MTSTTFTFKKPEVWPYMPLYEKIKYYGSILNESYSPFVDKLSAKRIVREMCPDVQTAAVVRVLDGPDDLSTADLNPLWMLKATHGSGWNVLLNGKVGVDELKKMLHGWNRPYSLIERQYTHIKPIFFIEEILDDKFTGRTGNARVFLIRCIHGKPMSVGVRYGGTTSNSKAQNNYLPDFTPITHEYFKIEKPTEWDRMLRFAAQLSAPFEFVRVDFYVGSDGQIYFSEYTFTPSGGNPFLPMRLEYEYGKLWT